MCGRFLLFTCDDYEELLSIVRDVEINNSVKNINMYQKTDIFPGDIVPIITATSDNRKAVTLSKWGFPNFKEKHRLLINARGETIEEKPTFKNLIMTKRCLIPAIGFYEWKKQGHTKEKYLIKPKELDFFYMAGLYNEFTNQSGENYNGFVIITTSSTKEMQPIHDRMPVIIQSTSHADKWINPSCSTIASIKSMINPYENSLSIVSQNTEPQQLQFKI